MCNLLSIEKELHIHFFHCIDQGIQKETNTTIQIIFNSKTPNTIKLNLNNSMFKKLINIIKIIYL